jgi:hypothetical protein
MVVLFCPMIDACLGYQDAHRLKQHIYRQHRIPVYCPRCKQNFKDEQSLEEHLTQSLVREVVSKDNVPEGFNAKQEMMLHKKEHKPNESQEQKWIAIYRILFPDDQDIPSPCTFIALNN